GADARQDPYGRAEHGADEGPHQVDGRQRHFEAMQQKRQGIHYRPANGKKPPNCNPSQLNSSQLTTPRTRPASRSGSTRRDPNDRATSMKDSMAVAGSPSGSMVSVGKTTASSAVKNARRSMG